MYYVGTISCGSMNELRHFGIPGMKWGVRRYRNEDGTLTEAGKARYGFGNGDGRGELTRGDRIARAGLVLGTGGSILGSTMSIAAYKRSDKLLDMAGKSLERMGEVKVGTPEYLREFKIGSNYLRRSENYKKIQSIAVSAAIVSSAVTVGAFAVATRKAYKANKANKANKAAQQDRRV